MFIVILIYFDFELNLCFNFFFFRKYFFVFIFFRVCLIIYVNNYFENFIIIISFLGIVKCVKILGQVQFSFNNGLEQDELLLDCS